jgi:hypothetical protein
MNTEKDFSVTSMTVTPDNKSLVFIFPDVADRDAIAVTREDGNTMADLAEYVGLHGTSITNAATYVELSDVRYLRSPKHSSKRYHIYIRLERPLAPDEIGRAFALDGDYAAVSFMNRDEAKRMLSQVGMVTLQRIPHTLRYVSEKVRTLSHHQVGP